MDGKFTAVAEIEVEISLAGAESGANVRFALRKRFRRLIHSQSTAACLTKKLARVDNGGLQSGFFSYRNKESDLAHATVCNPYFFLTAISTVTT